MRGDQKRHSRLRRLDRIWISNPVYFITSCTAFRRAILTEPYGIRALRDEWERAKAHYGWLVGRYVVMPDHVHFFCAEQSRGARVSLPRFIQRWKEWTSKMIINQSGLKPPIWQKGFFDHVLRSHESYAPKWEYVRENPVRAGLVDRWDAWSFAGFVDIDHPHGDVESRN